MFATEISAIQYKNSITKNILDPVVLEKTITLHLNGKKFVKIVVTAADLLEFGTGFFIAAGVAKKILSVKIFEENIFVEAEVFQSAETADGFTQAIQKNHPNSCREKINPEKIFELRLALEQNHWEKTGGLHTAALMHKNEIVYTASDIGRHNAVDKVIGFMLRNNLSPNDCAISSTGRQPKGMVIKAVNANIPIIVSRAAVTSSGVKAAKAYGITLIGFARSDEKRFTIYSHPKRVMNFSVTDSKHDAPKVFEDITEKIEGWKYQDGIITKIDELVVKEFLVTLHLNGKKFIKATVTKEMLKEFGAGFFISSGIAKKILSVKILEENIFVEAEGVLNIGGEIESGGGFSPDHVRGNVQISNVTLSSKEIFLIADSLTKDSWTATGGFHCSVLYHKGKVIASAVDISRQNTVDKIVGFMHLNSIPPEECVLGTTGRQPEGMVVKASNAQIPIIVSRAASTVSGIKVAEKTHVTLICFAREPRFTVYSHPKRVIF